jgi:uncharacterized membrane protein YgcG
VDAIAAAEKARMEREAKSAAAKAAAEARRERAAAAKEAERVERERAAKERAMAAADRSKRELDAAKAREKTARESHERERKRREREANERAKADAKAKKNAPRSSPRPAPPAAAATDNAAKKTRVPASERARRFIGEKMSALAAAGGGGDDDDAATTNAQTAGTGKKDVVRENYWSFPAARPEDPHHGSRRAREEEKPKSNPKPTTKTKRDSTVDEETTSFVRKLVNDAERAVQERKREKRPRWMPSLSFGSAESSTAEADERKARQRAERDDARLKRERERDAKLEKMKARTREREPSRRSAAPRFDQVTGRSISVPVFSPAAASASASASEGARDRARSRGSSFADAATTKELSDTAIIAMTGAVMAAPFLLARRSERARAMIDQGKLRLKRLHDVDGASVRVKWHGADARPDVEGHEDGRGDDEALARCADGHKDGHLGLPARVGRPISFAALLPEGGWVATRARAARRAASDAARKLVEIFAGGGNLGRRRPRHHRGGSHGGSAFGGGGSSRVTSPAQSLAAATEALERAEKRLANLTGTERSEESTPSKSGARRKLAVAPDADADVAHATGKESRSVDRSPSPPPRTELLSPRLIVPIKTPRRGDAPYAGSTPGKYEVAANPATGTYSPTPRVTASIAAAVGLNVSTPRELATPVAGMAPEKARKTLRAYEKRKNALLKSYSALEAAEGRAVDERELFAFIQNQNPTSRSPSGASSPGGGRPANVPPLALDGVGGGGEEDDATRAERLRLECAVLEGRLQFRNDDQVEVHERAAERRDALAAKLASMDAKPIASKSATAKRDALAAEVDAAAATAERERAKMERISSIVEDGEMSKRQKRTKKSIWHFTVTVKRRALLAWLQALDDAHRMRRAARKLTAKGHLKTQSLAFETWLEFWRVAKEEKIRRRVEELERRAAAAEEEEARAAEAAAAAREKSVGVAARIAAAEERETEARKKIGGEYGSATSFREKSKAFRRNDVKRDAPK